MTTPSSPVAKPSLIQKVKAISKKLFSCLSLQVLNIRNKLQSMNKKQIRIVYLFIGLAGLIFLILFWAIIIFHVRHHKVNTVPQQVKSQAVLMQNQAKVAAVEKNVVPLEKIQKELTEILQKPSSSRAETANYQALQQLSSRLSVLISEQKSSDANNQKQISTLLSTQKSLSQSNKAVEHQLSEIHKAVMPIHYLSASILPFHVEGLSFWNGKPMVTISMVGLGGQHFYKLIGQGGEYGCSFQSTQGHGCVSWMVKNINVNSGIVIFANHRGQFVKVTL